MKITLTITTAVIAGILSSCAPGTKTNTGEVPAPELTVLAKTPKAKPDPQGRKNLVISPYHPYNLIDVSKYESGDVAGDPSTAKTDRNTGKIIESTSKYFIIP